MFRKLIMILIAIAILIGLYLTSLYNFLLFHGLAEIFSIVVAFGIFVITWNSRQFMENGYLLFIGVAYLFVASIDLVHTFAYRGMNIFKGYDANLPTQLWIAARYLQSLSLLMANLLFRRKAKIHFVFFGYLVVTSFLLMSIFYWEAFPVCFIEGVGLTSFKKVSEYIISLILLSSILWLSRNREHFDKNVFQWVIWSILLTVASELAFTFYIQVYGFSNLMGHLLKIVAFYFIYKAIIETGLRRPYDLLFRDLKESKDQIQKSHNELEERVRERTVELLEANEMLRAENIERKQAELRIEHLNRLYATLSQVNEAIVRVKDRDELFRSISKVGVDYGKFGLAWIGVVDHEAGKVTPMAVHGIGHEQLPFNAIHYKEMPFKEGLIGKAVQSGEVVYSRDIQSDPAMRHWREMAMEGGYRAATAVPFRLDGEIAGLLNLYATDVDFFEDDGLRNLLKEVAAEISFSLEFLDKETKRKQSEEELRLLQTIAFAISEVENLDSALKIVLQKVCETTGWVMGEAWVPKSNGTSLECSPAWYSGAKGLEKFRKESGKMEFPPGIGLPGRVWVSKKPEWIKDISSDPNFLRAEMAKEVGIRTAMAIPVLVGGEMIAVMNYFGFEFRKEDERLLETTSSVATQLGSLIQRKQVEEERAKIEAQLIQAQKMETIGTLAGGVAHDFNNILTTIQGYAQLGLMTMKEGEPLCDNLKEILQASQRAANLTRQLLLFSRKQPIEPFALNLSETVNSLMKMLKRLIGEDIIVETHLEPNLWTVQADPGSVEQVVMNLVVNARDAMPEGGKITIKTENVHIGKEYREIYSYGRPGKFVRLSVEDTGTGMDKEVLRHIFEPFFTTKGLGKGTGLGLSVVYGIVKQAEGWINVYSEPGRGSVFKVYLPASYVESKEETKKEITSIDDFHGKGERILLVEDDDAIRGFAEKILVERGYVRFAASNAEEALNIFEREKGNFDLVFSDVVLFRKSGLQLVGELLSRKPELRVLLTSGYTDQKSQWDMIKEKGYRFIQKPYNVEDVLRVLREVLDS